MLLRVPTPTLVRCPTTRTLAVGRQSIPTPGRGSTGQYHSTIPLPAVNVQPQAPGAVLLEANRHLLTLMSVFDRLTGNGYP